MTTTRRYSSRYAPPKGSAQRAAWERLDDAGRRLAASMMNPRHGLETIDALFELDADERAAILAAVGHY